MAGRDHDPGIQAERGRRVVENGRRDHSRVHDMDARARQTATKRFMISRRGESAVAPRDGAPPSLVPEEDAYCPTKEKYGFRVEIFFRDAANVVCPEYG